MVFMDDYINHVAFESGSHDAEVGSELIAGLEDIIEIVFALLNEKSVTSSPTTAKRMSTGKKNECRTRAEALKSNSLGNLTAAHKELIKTTKEAKLESKRAKQQ